MLKIELQAKLRAYSRMPFYSDYIREAPQDNSQYVRLNGSWSRLDTTLLGASLDEFKEEVRKLQNQLGAIDVYLDYATNRLIFIDCFGNPTFITLPGANVDETTIGLGDLNKMYVMDVPDNKTIKVVDVVTKPLEEDPNIVKKVSGKLRVEGIYAENDSVYLTGQELLNSLKKLQENISNIEEFTQGSGGFLNPYTFFPDDVYNKEGYPLQSLDEAVRNIILTNYAIDQLQGKPLENQTKIKDMFDGRIWIWNGDTWADNGRDTIVDANNYGVKGAVTGVPYNPEDISTKFKISIEEDDKNVPTGIMSVNGLKEEFEQVIYKTNADVNATPDTYAKRNSNGTIAISDSINDSDAINQGQFLQWQEEAAMNSEDIFDIVNTIFLPEIPLTL